jgi:hypothetical protein
MATTANPVLYGVIDRHFLLVLMILFIFFSGVINMSHVLQRQDMDQELELVEGKGGGAVLGKVGLQGY